MMQLMYSNTTKKVLNIGQPPWSNQDQLSNYTIVNYNGTIGVDWWNYDYNESTGTLVYNPVPEYSIEVVEPSSMTILGNGVHVAKVQTMVKYALPMPSIDTITIIDQGNQTINLVDGIGNLEFTSTQPNTFIKLEYHGKFAVVSVV